MTNADPNTRVKVTVDNKLKEPSLFKLIYVNDNETAMEFVIKTLMEIFHYKAETAEIKPTGKPRANKTAKIQS